MKAETLIGNRYGRVIILGRDPTKYKSNYAIIRCDCGKKKSVLTRDLLLGKTKSCGCLREEIIAKGRDNTNRNANSRAYNTNIKTEVLGHYSPNGILKCSDNDCCINDIDMLTLDHVNNDGAKDRQEGRKQTGVALYGMLKRAGYPEGFSTLCCNHQMKKDLNLRRNLACKKAIFSYIIPMMLIGSYGKDLQTCPV
jgi:hypothetical protein